MQINYNVPFSIVVSFSLHFLTTHLILPCTFFWNACFWTHLHHLRSWCSPRVIFCLKQTVVSSFLLPLSQLSDDFFLPDKRFNRRCESRSSHWYHTALKAKTKFWKWAFRHMFTHISAFTTLFNIGIYDCSIVHRMTEKKEGQFLNVKKSTLAVLKNANGAF